ncbi:MAG: hypothetical protein NXI08_16420 [bacterium]|jgi:hypothetical protein|nr:hypothetical protein [bacterium]
MDIRKTLTKIILSIIFLYGLYLVWAVIAFGGGCKRMVSETHILPNRYTGKVYIFFNQDEGYKAEYEDNTRVYRIPKSGILRTQFKPNSGWIDSKKYLNFYYEDGDSMIPLNKYISGKDSLIRLDSNSIVVFEYGIGTGWEAFKQGEINATTYIVDSLKNFNKRDYILTKEEFDNWDK